MLCNRTENRLSQGKESLLWQMEFVSSCQTDGLALIKDAGTTVLLQTITFVSPLPKGACWNIHENMHELTVSESVLHGITRAGTDSGCL